MPRARSAASVAIALALLAAGCEDAEQHAARRAVEAQIGGGKTHCTRTAREYVQAIPTKLYICIVQRQDGRCDEYAAIRRQGGFDVRPRRKGVDCLLPIG